MKTKTLLIVFILSAFVGQLRGAEVSSAEEQRLSFRGTEAEFNLRIGQRARIVGDEIGTMEIELLSATAEGVNIFFSSSFYKESQKKINIGQEFTFLTGGLEQTGTLTLLEFQDTTAKFKIEFGSAPPAPKIASDMPVDIIYLK